VPVATLEQLDAAAVPVVVEPELPGRWRWIGTRTLRFEHAGEGVDRLPMATGYTVTVPAGTTSATGGVLAEAVSVAFTTPAPTLLDVQPQGESTPLQPVLVATFDQRVDPAALLEHLRLEADGDRALRLATDEEVAADELAQQVVDRALEARWVAVRPVEPLPADTPVTFTVLQGAPSAEGPRTTAADQSVRGRTYPPLRIVRTDCGYGGGCAPLQPFVLSFSNPLDAAAFDPDAVTVAPAPPGLQVQVQGTELVVLGQTEPDTTYTVTVPAGLLDERGQTLGEDETREFEVGDPRPFLRPFDGDLITLDPLAERPSLSVLSAGHEELRVVALRVAPEDWARYLQLPRYDEQVEVPDLPVIFDRTVDTGGQDGGVVETVVDLSEAFPEGIGHAVVYVAPTRDIPPRSDEWYENQPTFTWVQSTTVGIDAVNDHGRLVVWTTDLRDGRPLAGAEVDLGGTTATTGADGVATLDLDGGNEAALTATVDGDTALLGSYPGRWAAQPRGDQARWYTIDDRGLYRPGEPLRLKGWVRRLALSGDADLVLPEAGARVTYQVYDGQYAEVATGEAVLNALGGFDLSADLPAGANLGQGVVALQLQGAAGLDGAAVEHAFQIQEFRRPEFEVTAAAASPAPHLATRPVTVAATARYFAGGGVPNAPVTWTVTQQETTYRPPGWDGFTFGVEVPWWAEPYGGYGGGDVVAFDEGFGDPGICCPPPGAEPTVERLDGVTDVSGSHHLQIELEGDPPDRPLRITADAAVEDVNRQAFAASTDLLVHPGRRVVGLASDRAFVHRGEPLRIDAILTDLDGAAIEGQALTVTAERLVDELVDGEYQETAVDPRTCEVTTAAEPQRCELPTDVGGRHRISAVATDEEGGTSRTELVVWVSGAEAVPSRRVEQEQLTLIPSRQTYAVGDTAEVLVPAPFSPATALVTITRDGIEETRVVEVVDGSAVVEVPITEDAVGGLGVQVDLVGAAARLGDDGAPLADAPPRPAFATGSTRLDVPPVTRTLTVEAAPRDAVVAPGASTAVDVRVTGPDGAPVAGADLAVVVVDEAVLSLIGYQLADPVAAFFADPGTWLSTESLRRTLRLSRADVLTGEGLDVATDGAATATGAPAAEQFGATEEAAAAGADTAGGAVAAPAPTSLDSARLAGAPPPPPIEVREDFDALAVFAPSVPTDADGRATVDVDLPDSLTRYRIMAVAASGADRFGSGESALTAQLPLQVRPSAPRFANFGDAFELPVVLHNVTDADLPAEVVLETANLATEGAAGPARAGLAVTVPAGDRVEVRFPVATEDAGTARYRVTAVAGDAADSATGSLPVHTPATMASFATYGVLDGGSVAQPLLTPEGVVPQVGGLEVTTSTTALQALTDAVIYLTDYPYDSTDAFASRLLAVAALRDVLDAFDAEGLPPPEELTAAVAEDVAGLVALQNADGGWPVWQRGRRSSPYHSIQAAHALVAARAAGAEVPEDAVLRALDRLRTIEALLDEPTGDLAVPEVDPMTRLTLRAYALHVRALAGDRDPAQAAAVHGELVGLVGADGTLPLDALAWLWPVVDDPAVDAAIERTLLNQVTETPSAATFATGYDETTAALVLGSDRRTDGIVLDALLTRRPDSDLIPKVVNGLIANQRQGRWDNVQENAFILLALKRYFDTFEATDPDLVARVWLGDLYAAEHTYQGRTTDSTLTVVPTAELLARDDPSLVLSAEGEGRLYYRLGLRTAPDDLVLEPRDEGFVVQREYAPVGDPDDVVRGEDGTWRIRAGAEVEVTLTMVADSRRVNMALVDPLPAGLEIVNPALAASPALPPPPAPEDDGDGGRPIPLIWQPTWFEHQNLRDDRAEAFSGHLEAGTYTYTYVARATTPGTFVVPPAVAEEIYTPEVFGRTATDTVVVAG
jgi:alpha-2-macroglobulin